MLRSQHWRFPRDNSDRGVRYCNIIIQRLNDTLCVYQLQTTLCGVGEHSAWRKRDRNDENSWQLKRKRNAYNAVDTVVPTTTMHRLIFFSLGKNEEIKRPFRQGQTRPVVFVNLHRACHINHFRTRTIKIKKYIYIKTYH